MRRFALFALLLLTAGVADAQSPSASPQHTEVEHARDAATIPFPSASERWIRARSKHFLFISSANERRTREVAAELETLAAALTQVDSTFSAPSAAPTRVILFASEREVRPYFGALRKQSDVSAVFVTGREGGTMLIRDASTWRGGNRPPLHELVHYLLQSGDAHIPLWLDEGLAEYFSNATIRGGSISAGEPMLQHVTVLREHPRIPPADLFGITQKSETYNVPPGQKIFYAESWAIVDWLVRTASRSGTEFYAFVRDVGHGVPVATALQNRYHRPLRDFDWALSRFLTMPRAGWTITIPVPPTDTNMTLEPLDRPSTLSELGRFLGGINELSGEAERHYRAALATSPRHARALAGLGTLRAAAGRYAESTAFFDQAIAADPNDVEVALAYAEALMQDQMGSLAQPAGAPVDDTLRFRKARTLVQAMLVHRDEPGFPRGRVLGDLGATYNVESDVDPGIAALEEARKLLPARSDFALDLLALYRRKGDRARADALESELDALHDVQLTHAAKTVIVRADLTRANALTSDQHLEEAAALMHDVSANTSEPSAHNVYEKQAEQLARTAERNRQVRAYNQIVAQVNSGHFREAIQALNAFLPTATDPDIVRDATDLQKQLADWRP